MSWHRKYSPSRVETTTKGNKLSTQASIRALLENVNKKAMRVEYYKHFGNHGDGKDVEAKEELKKANRELISAINSKR